MARLNLNLNDDIYKRLKEEALREGRSVSDVVRVMVNEWLKRKSLDRSIQEEGRKSGNVGA